MINAQGDGDDRKREEDGEIQWMVSESVYEVLAAQKAAGGPESVSDEVVAFWYAVLYGDDADWT